MCRLFGLNAGSVPVHVSYWLVAAPDSISVQSQRNPDGSGIGWFDDAGAGHVAKWPDRAAADAAFQDEAMSVDSATLVTHVRAATTGRRSVANCHPFLIENRLMAHNGGFGDLPAVEAKLGDWMRFVEGDTDSERYAALIAQQTHEHDGSVAAGLTAAARWLSANVPMYSLNTIVSSPGNLRALRYPDQRALHVATRSIQPGSGAPEDAAWSGRTPVARHTVDSVDSRPVKVVVVASERIDESDDWQMLQPGELVHVGPDLSIRSAVVLDDPPAQFHLPPGTDPNFDGF